MDYSEEDTKNSTDLARNKFCTHLIDLRTQADYTPSRAALATRISLPLIEALERGDLNKMPGLVFGRGFVKNLSRLYTGAINHELVDEFEELCHLMRISPDTISDQIEDFTPKLPVHPKHKPSKKISLRHFNPAYYFRKGPLLLGLGSLILILTMFQIIQGSDAEEQPTKLTNRTINNAGLHLEAIQIPMLPPEAHDKNPGDPDALSTVRNEDFDWTLIQPTTFYSYDLESHTHSEKSQKLN